jgi:hypothetical protein
MLARNRASPVKQPWSADMPRELWELLLEDPSDLTCDECFAVMEYYAEALTDRGVDLLPRVIEHLEGCPDCALQHRDALRGLLAGQPEGDAALSTGATGGEGSEAKGQ